MQITKKELPKSQMELTVELSVEEFKPYIEKGANKVSEQVKIEGFRPGKVPFEILKQKIGEMTILEEAAHVAIHKTIDEVLAKETMERQAVGQPEVNITKLAPGNVFEYKIVASLIPTVALGKYKDLGVKFEEPEVSDEELDKAMAELRELRAKEVIVDRPVEESDKVIVDVSLFVDKVPVEDGQHKDLAVIMGRDYLVPGFDKKLVGAKKGEDREFVLPYPEDYHLKALAGKKVDFKVKIKEIYSRELPELDDEFAKQFGLKNLDGLKEHFKRNLLEEKKQRLDRKTEAELISKIVDDTKIGEIPEIMIDTETKNMLSEVEQNVIRQGGKFEDYLQHIKKDRASLMLDFVPNAIKRVKSALVIRELAIVEKIETSPDEIKTKKDELKQRYVNNKDILSMLEEPGYDRYLSSILTNEKVIAKLKEWNYARTGAK